MNAPLTSHHYYVADLPEDVDLLQNSQDIAQALRELGHDPLEHSYASLFVRFNEDSEPVKGWGTYYNAPRDADRVYVVDRRN